MVMARGLAGKRRGGDSPPGWSRTRHADRPQHRPDAQIQRYRPLPRGPTATDLRGSSTRILSLVHTMGTTRAPGIAPRDPASAGKVKTGRARAGHGGATTHPRDV